MGSGFERLMNADIPDEMYLARNVRQIARHWDTMSKDEYRKTVVAVIAGNVMELEGRLLVVEKKTDIQPRQPLSLDA
jgi:hypothetical protein